MIDYENIKNVFDLVAKHYKILVRNCIVFGILATVIAFVLPKKYTATAALLPSGAGGGPLGFISGFIPGVLENLTAEGVSSYLFPEILKSRSVVLPVLNEPFDSALQSQTGCKTLSEYIGGSSFEDKIEAFLNMGQVEYSFEKGTRNLRCESEYPELSFFVVDTWMRKLEIFLQENLQTQAKRNYNFLNEQYEIALNNASTAEDTISGFIRRTRNFVNDPIANMQYRKLQMTFDNKLNVMNYISQQVEKERLNMIKSLPSISVLDSPIIPTRKSAPKRSLIMLAGLMFGVVVSVVQITIERFRYLKNDNLREQK